MPLARNRTSSAILVAWSAIRSRLRTTESRSTACRILLRVLLHEADQFVEAGVAQVVDGVVGRQDAARQVGIAPDKRIEALANHGLHQCGDMRDVDHGLARSARSAARSRAARC